MHIQREISSCIVQYGIHHPHGDFKLTLIKVKFKTCCLSCTNHGASAHRSSAVPESISSGAAAGHFRHHRHFYETVLLGHQYGH